MSSLRTRLHPSRVRAKMDSAARHLTSARPGFRADTSSQLQDRPKMPSECTRPTWARASLADVRGVVTFRTAVALPYRVTHE